MAVNWVFKRPRVNIYFLTEKILSNFVRQRRRKAEKEGEKEAEIWMRAGTKQNRQRGKDKRQGVRKRDGEGETVRQRRRE